MGTYTRYDFSESLDRVHVAPAAVAAVLAAWGRSPEGGGSWEGGFLLELKAGGYAYVAGWCDYTGWGCQDGAEVRLFVKRPALTDLQGLIEYPDPPPPEAWDDAPADLNRWLAAGAQPDDIHV